MIYLDQTCSSPVANLALDEWLLDDVERQGGAWLRTWQPAEEFVVLGRGNKAETEVNLDECRRAGVPVLKRSSGGGAVLLGPGCFCYSVIMEIDSAVELASAQGTNEWMLRRVSRAFGADLSIAGDSDLVLGDRKVAGHAQRRKRSALLFHGSVMLDMDSARMERFLRYPSRVPDHRRHRGHSAFVTNLGTPPDSLARALVLEWRAEPSHATIPEHLLKS